MGVHESRGNLNKSLKDLMLRWQETKMSWSDSRSEAFEKQYLETLALDLRMAISAMEEAGVLLHQIERDCS